MNTTSKVPTKELDSGLILIKTLLSQIKEKTVKQQIIPVAYVDDSCCDKHKLIIPNHYESAKRTSVIRKAIEKYKLGEFMIKTGSISLTKSHMHSVHDPEYIEKLIYCGKLNKPIEIPGSTEISMSDIGSLESVFAAAASVIGGVDTVCGKFLVNDNKYSSRRVRKVFCNVRPPGHHSHKDHGSGFCFMNNVAIGAKFAFEKYPTFIKKILIFDWDLHHGNGTEDIFKDDPRVMYVSFHRGGNDINDIFYPYSGTTHVNDLHPNIINFPITADESVESYMTKFREEFLPLAYAFDPDLVFISAGFDSHKDDLYHALPLDYQHFHEMTKELSKLADTCATGRLVSVLEGGYTPNVLYRCAIIHMLTMVNGYD